MNEFFADLKKRFTGKRLMFLTLPYLLIGIVALVFMKLLGYATPIILLIWVIGYNVANWAWDRADEIKNQNSDS